jgi:hypothetical protein
MGNDVFANGREISCKAADGTSICAFPDVCFTPPQTPATPPGVPIPYPNTGFARDTTSGSRTVRITGKEVMLKNKSYFKKSMGDEAGCAPKKGILTSVNRGKVYFNAWSMDIKAEGQNVVRHLDLTSHNHASVPGNSPAWPYLDEMGDEEKRKNCGTEMDTVQSHCKRAKDAGKTHLDCPADKGEYKTDPCMKAKRCMLVPYNRGKTKGGCCEVGNVKQTPDHLIPKHHFKSQFNGYDEDNAPCVCAEGYSWHRSDKSVFYNDEKTHPDLHDLRDPLERAAMEAVTKMEKEGTDTNGRTRSKALQYQEVRHSSIMAHEEVFRGSGCSSKCLAAQLDAYHKQNDVGVADDDLVTTKKAGSKGEEDKSEEFVEQLQEDSYPLAKRIKSV